MKEKIIRYLTIVVCIGAVLLHFRGIDECYIFKESLLKSVLEIQSEHEITDRVTYSRGNVVRCIARTDDKIASIEMRKRLGFIWEKSASFIQSLQTDNIPADTQVIEFDTDYFVELIYYGVCVDQDIDKIVAVHADGATQECSIGESKMYTIKVDSDCCESITLFGYDKQNRKIWQSE